MTNFELKYNPFDVKTNFFIDGKETNLECCGTGKNIRLRDYIDKFFPAAIKKSNLGPGEDCVVQFYGTHDAFEDVKKAYQEYTAQTQDIKIELPPYKPYPNNFSEMNILIDKKREHYAEQIEQKKQGKSNVELLDVVKQFNRDKDTIERIYSDNIKKINAALEKAKEGFGSLSSDEEEKEKTVKKPAVKKPAPKMKQPLAWISSGENNISWNYLGALTGLSLLGIGVGLSIYKSLSSGADGKEIIEQIKSTYTQDCGELTSLLGSSFNKIDIALYSEFEAIYKDYTAAYSDFMASNDTLPKHKQKNNAFAIQETIPDSCFEELRRKTFADFLDYQTEKDQENIKRGLKKVCSSFQAFLDSVFESAKKDFLLETEKCKAFYLKELSQLQESIAEKLAAAKHTEQEITALENRIACLDELKNEINKLAAS